MMKNIRKPLVMLVVMAAAGVWWSKLTASKKRSFYHMGKQVPYMPFRYFA